MRILALCLSFLIFSPAFAANNAKLIEGTYGQFSGTNPGMKISYDLRSQDMIVDFVVNPFTAIEPILGESRELFVFDPVKNNYRNDYINKDDPNDNTYCTIKATSSDIFQIKCYYTGNDYLISEGIYVKYYPEWDNP